MTKSIIHHILAASLALMILALAGCSSPQKSAQGSSTPRTASNSDSFSASAKKVEQDFAQTESDFGKLESFASKK